MARFIRDEKRTYPFMWMAIGGVFAASSAWAVYAELVTRVPWQKQQQAFFDQAIDRLADRNARDRELSGQIALGGQSVVRAQQSALDGIA